MINCDKDCYFNVEDICCMIEMDDPRDIMVIENMVYLDVGECNLFG